MASKYGTRLIKPSEFVNIKQFESFIDELTIVVVRFFLFFFIYRRTWK